MGKASDRPSVVDYSSTTTPEGYKCDNCGVTDCKLWREYQYTRLLCAVCAADFQDKDISDIDENGMRSQFPEEDNDLRTDQIGWYVPAIPDEEGEGYWGYTSVASEGVVWWKNLPTLPN